jgi:hypothetical protein
MVCHLLIRHLDCHPASVTAGRRFVSDALTTWGWRSVGPEPGPRADILLVATELLSNAVKAASAPVVLSVEGHHNRVDISVADDSPEPAVRVPTGIDSPGGRGLLLVDALAEDWGQRRLDDRTKEVWAQVPVPTEATLGLDCTHLPI